MGKIGTMLGILGCSDQGQHFWSFCHGKTMDEKLPSYKAEYTEAISGTEPAQR